METQPHSRAGIMNELEFVFFSKERVLDENYLLVCFGMQETMDNLKQMSAKPFSETQDIIFNVIMVFHNPDIHDHPS